VSGEFRGPPSPRARTTTGCACAVGLAAALFAVYAVRCRPSARFVHPGVLVTRAQLDFVRDRIAANAEPWASAFERARADAHGSRTVLPHPPIAAPATETSPATEDGVVLCGSFSDPDVHCSDEKEDGAAAYTQALLWVLSGDEAYAANAVAILNAWSVLKEHRLFNAALQAAWMGSEFARAAEIMQLWPRWEARDVRAFKEMMRRAFLPRLVGALPGVAAQGDASHGQNGNWPLSIADSLVQIGVLLDDRDVFAQGVELWRDRVPAYCYLAAADGVHPRLPCGGYAGSNAGYASTATRTGDAFGYWGQANRGLTDGVAQEMCRDLEHVQFGLAAITNAAETARIQGVDLYREQSARLVACLEHVAEYENDAPRDASGKPLAYATPVASPVTVVAREPALCPDAAGKPRVVLLNGGSQATHAALPTWEIGYNELANRLGNAMPNTKRLVETYRSPPTGWAGITHHIGWETLTHGDVGSVGLTPAPPCAGAR
jgi:Alginate lyase